MKIASIVFNKSDKAIRHINNGLNSEGAGIIKGFKNAKGCRTIIRYSENGEINHSFSLLPDGTRIFKQYSSNYVAGMLNKLNRDISTFIEKKDATISKFFRRTFENGKQSSVASDIEHSNGFVRRSEKTANKHSFEKKFPNGDFYNVKVENGKIKEVEKQFGDAKYNFPV